MTESVDVSVASEVEAAANRLEIGLGMAVEWLSAGAAVDGLDTAAALAELSTATAEDRRRQRAVTLERTARRELTAQAADGLLLATRWVDSLAYHTWRIVHHLAGASPGEGEVRPDGGGLSRSSERR